jgi:hypothetical protein
VRSMHVGSCAKSATTWGNSTSASTLSVGCTPNALMHELETFTDHSGLLWWFYADLKATGSSRRGVEA